MLLLDAAGRRSLTSLEQALVALARVIVLRSRPSWPRLVLPPPPPDEKVFEWRSGYVSSGRSFRTEAEVDAGARAMSKELKSPHPRGLHGRGEVTRWTDRNDAALPRAQALSDSLKEAVKAWVPKVRQCARRRVHRRSSIGLA